MSKIIGQQNLFGNLLTFELFSIDYTGEIYIALPVFEMSGEGLNCINTWTKEYHWMDTSDLVIYEGRLIY